MGLDPGSLAGDHTSSAAFQENYSESMRRPSPHCGSLSLLQAGPGQTQGHPPTPQAALPSQTRVLSRPLVSGLFTLSQVSRPTPSAHLGEKPRDGRGQGGVREQPSVITPMNSTHLGSKILPGGLDPVRKQRKGCQRERKTRDEKPVPR